VVDTATTRAADVVLPLSAPAETSGTFTNQERRVQRFRQAVAPRPGMETWQLLCELAARLGLRFKMKYAGVDAVTDEIRRIAPIYRDVVVDSPDADGTWDLGRFPLPRHPAGPADPAGPGRPFTPAATLPLDALEARFARWFEKTIADAQRALTG
jgi:formate dehydrogenase major subunit